MAFLSVGYTGKTVEWETCLPLYQLGVFGGSVRDPLFVRVQAHHFISQRAFIGELSVVNVSSQSTDTLFRRTDLRLYFIGWLPELDRARCSG